MKVLIGGVKAFPDAGKKALSDRAAAVRKGGMAAIADTVTAAGTSQKTKSSNNMAIAAGKFGHVRNWTFY